MVEGEGRRDEERHEDVTEGEDEVRIQRSEE